jgi:4-amino-4-deoxy-L-arabinose transferase-like glycosyltransferase
MDVGKIADRVPVPFLLAAVIVACLPPYLIRAGRGHVRYHMEALTFVTSQETWLRLPHEPVAWLLPSWNGQPRVNKPPMSVWINLLAWRGLPPDADVESLTWRARLAGAGMTALMLAAVFSIGWQLGGRRHAVAAALATGTMITVIHHARLAMYDTHLAAWTALAVAAGLWALRRDPGQTAARLAGAALAGAALAGGILTKGPIAVALAAIPLVAMAFLLPGPRSPRWRALALLAVVAAGLALPWYLHLLSRDSGAAGTLAEEYRAQRREFQAPWYYLNTIGLVFPWSVWFAAGAFAAARGRTAGDRRWRVMLAWFGVVFLMLSIPAAKKIRYIFPALPAAGALAAFAWFRSDAWPPRAERWLRALHWTPLVLASAAPGVFLLVQDALVRRGALSAPELPGVHPAQAVAVSLLLLALSVWGAAAHARGRRSQAFAATAAWMIAAMTFANAAYAESHHARYPQLAECRQVVDRVGDRVLLYLLNDPGADVQPDAKFLIYARRVVPPVRPADLSAARASGAWIIARDLPANREKLAKAGFEVSFPFRDGGAPRVLFRPTPAADGGSDISRPRTSTRETP